MFEPGFLGFLTFLLLTSSAVTSDCLHNEQITTPNNKYVANDIVHYYNKNGQGIRASVSYTGTDEYYEKPSSPIVQTLNMSVTFDSESELTIILDDASQPRFKLPYEAPYPFTKPSTDPLRTPLYSIQIEQEPFSFSIIRTKTGETIFNTSAFDFVYSDYYLTFGTSLPSKYLYGLGERRRDFLYDSGLYTIWNKDQFAQIDNGQGNQQTYGCHPMYMMREQSAFWHVVYLRNSNGMDFKFDSGAQTLQYMLTGGVIELKFFFGEEMPDTVLQLYHNYINGWTLMPFWAHGYHQSKYGVLYLQDLLEVLGNFTQYKIPIDVIWSDIDYMYSFTDFTVDDERYNVAELKQLAESIRWVPIVDAGVGLNTTADSYNFGQTYNVWIRSANNNSNPLVGVVWPGVVHWPDWLNPNASQYWSQLLQEFHSTVPFSGIWLDMNEYSNFCTGEFNNSCTFLADYLPDGVYPYGNTIIPPGDQNNSLPPSPWAWFNSSALPYIPGGVPLEQKSLSINALHYGDILEHYMHNVNGFLESAATYKSLQTLTGERPFILSRSTHVGSGQFAAHWSGDNSATWEFLRLSVSCVFNFQLYGVPMTGDDICGYAGNVTVELCARWMQLGAFYPFMRNHMQIGNLEHYPYSLGETVLQASIDSLKLRYSLLKHYYTLFISLKGTGTVFRPLFFDYNYDTSLLALDTQFLIGSGLMVAAVVQEGQTEVNVYFPSSLFPWYNFFTGDLIQNAGDPPKNVSFPASLNGTLPVFIRGGSITAVQNTDNVTSTKDLNNVFNLVVPLLPNGDIYEFASGQILGISNYSIDSSLDQCTGQNSCMVRLDLSGQLKDDGTWSFEILFQKEGILEDVYIADIILYGVRTQSCDPESKSCITQTNVVVCNQGETFAVIAPAVATFTVNGTTCSG